MIKKTNKHVYCSCTMVAVAHDGVLGPVARVTALVTASFSASYTQRGTACPAVWTQHSSAYTDTTVTNKLVACITLLQGSSGVAI